MPTPRDLVVIDPNSDLFVSPAPRLPVVVILDTSGSMEGAPLEELQEGFALFLEQVASDPDAATCADVAVLTVGGDVTTHRAFGLAQRGERPSFEAGGDTPLAEAVEIGLALLDARKTQYKAAGTPYFQPWIVLITDGQPTDAPRDLARVAGRTSSLIGDRKLTIFPIAVGADADLVALQKLAGGTKPQRLKGLAFRELFKWLSASVAGVSRSTPGQGMAMPSPFEWVAL